MTVGETIERRCGNCTHFVKETYYVGSWCDLFGGRVDSRNRCQIEPKMWEARDTECQGEWFPFKVFEKDGEEYVRQPLPGNGEDVIVTVEVDGAREARVDEFLDLEDGVYLASGLDIGGEALAWTPLPKAWEGKVQK